jgi:hypothetical protein
MEVGTCLTAAGGASAEDSARWAGPIAAPTNISGPGSPGLFSNRPSRTKGGFQCTGSSDEGPALHG